ncbi:MAG: hypothetical protein COU09_02935 [Candidatus Harrisonbacteria bacterium CG10_big_fil_rev_8_21_14_0_10_44_23]|uniref:Uncharacterized protein n=1 Tax=Candidatus Harrisonbacteria bacterium CG10_big_fil_rev_8_21_14_0_10_44_23 TaxID=1974585 RepID=A0A2H0UPI3_9BACT|nr:MAG: hypothetical protein COU09_02935 [Candidatus Harrisonbacteria bacterium CG10_big_fil_rev_8_21_14_0_10_44_23]
MHFSKIKDPQSMASVNKWADKVLKSFYELVPSLGKSAEVKKLFELLFTVHERHNLAKRLLGFKRIIEGSSYRKLNGTIGLSYQTVSAMKTSLKKQNYISYYTISIPAKQKRQEEKNRKFAKRDTKPRQSGRYRKTKYGRSWFLN